ADRDAGVRRHAVRLAEPRLATGSTLAERVLGLAADADAQVRLQVAYSLGAWRDRRAADALARLVGDHAADPILTAAAMSSLTPENLPVIADAVLRLPEPPAAVVRDLLATAAATDGGETLARLLALVGRPAAGTYRAWQLTAAAGALDALERQGKSWPKLDAATRAALAPLVAHARSALGQGDALPGLPLLGRDPATRADDVKRLSGLLVATRPAAVQTAAVAALTRIGTPD